MRLADGYCFSNERNIRVRRAYKRRHCLLRRGGGHMPCAGFFLYGSSRRQAWSTDRSGRLFQHFRSPLAADFASHNFNTPLNGVFKVFFRQTAGQITDIIVGDRQTAVFVGPGRCFRGKSVHCLNQLPGFGNTDAAAVGKSNSSIFRCRYGF